MINTFYYFVLEEQTIEHLRGNTLWRFNSNGRVPLARGQHRHAVEELVDACKKVVSISCFVRNVVENLQMSQYRPRYHRQHNVAAISTQHEHGMRFFLTRSINGQSIN